MSVFFTVLTFLTYAAISLALDEEVVYKFGDKTATLSCNDTEHAASVFQGWYFGGKLLANSTRYTVQSQSQTSVLNISKPVRSDLGNYTASYSLKNCTVSYTASPLVLDMVKSQNLEKGNDLDIHCDVRGFPGSVVTWTRDGVELTMNTSRVTLKDDGLMVNAYLHIKSLDYSDEGTYNCSAYSVHFNKSHSKSLIVRVKNPIAWVWPLVGIIIEVIFLAVIIFACAKFDKRRLIQSEQNDLHHNEGHGTRKHGDDKTD